jgi:hypothetical protein
MDSGSKAAAWALSCIGGGNICDACSVSSSGNGENLANGLETGPARLLIEHPDLAGLPNDDGGSAWTEVCTDEHSGNSATAALCTTIDEHPVHRHPVTRLLGDHR